MSYATPIVLRLTTGRKTFQPGPFSLGKWSTPINIVAVAWTCFLTVLFIFPSTVNPTASTMSECTFQLVTKTVLVCQLNCADLTTMFGRLHDRRAYGGLYIRFTLVDLVGAQVVQGSRADHCAGRGSCCCNHGAQ